MTAEPTEPARLRGAILDAIALAVEALPWLRSATVAGSFATADSLEGASDIDLIVVADTFDRTRLDALQSAFRTRLLAVLNPCGWDLFVNMTLGPLKFDRDRLAVLHLMPYAVEGHIRHAIDSPFTCLDWQNAPIVHGESLRDIYPVFGLQPRHFLSARRGLGDYLRDLRADVVSWREIVGDGNGIREIPRTRPMDGRDRLEFAYHILKFTMRNILKLLLRQNDPPSGERLAATYIEHLPTGSREILELARELAVRKRNRDFAAPVDRLEERLLRFLTDAEAGLRTIFEAEAIDHLVLRHAKPQGLSDGPVRFLGRADPGLADGPLEPPSGNVPQRVVTSPSRRCVETVARLGLQLSATDPRLLEIDYGSAEGMDFAELQRAYPEIVRAWNRSEDPKFPEGECTADVVARVLDYLGDPGTARDSTIVTHNVVVRCMLGIALNVPRSQWHRLRVAYATPIPFRWHARYGLFVDLEPHMHRTIFGDCETVSGT